MYINITSTGKQSLLFLRFSAWGSVHAHASVEERKTRNARSEGGRLSRAIHSTDYTGKERLLVVQVAKVDSRRTFIVMLHLYGTRREY